jgi:glutamate dehydrogenase (NADP+)
VSPTAALDGPARRELERIMDRVVERNPHEPEFQQAVHELAESVVPIVVGNPDLHSERILDRMVEPDRIVSFRVTWEDDDGGVRINRGWRVQFNHALGPYKGGLRFHPSVNQSILKFLGFEQTFKNALTTLPMGGGKGGSDFDPKGRSDREVMRFCQSFMTELYRHIGDSVDTPAGDIGVGAREIGFLFGQYIRIESAYSGALTGKGLGYGGSRLRPEATGYGLGYFVRHMADDLDLDLDGRTVSVSGAGNVATYAVEKLTELGARVVTMSDSGGTIHDPAGIDAVKLAAITDLKQVRRGRLATYAAESGCNYLEGSRPWAIPVDIALPCATQNELVAAANQLREHGVAFGPAKACNAGGVAVSGLEQTQNAIGLTLPASEIDERLQGIMGEIHRQCVEHGTSADGSVDYLTGANRAGFAKVASAMLSFGLI